MRYSVVDLVMCVLQQEYKQNVKARNVFKTKKPSRWTHVKATWWMNFLLALQKHPKHQKRRKCNFFFKSCAKKKKSNIQFSRGITTAVMSFSWTLKFSILDGASRLGVVVATAETRSKKPKKRRKRGENGQFHSYLGTWLLSDKEMANIPELQWKPLSSSPDSRAA